MQSFNFLKRVSFHGPFYDLNGNVKKEYVIDERDIPDLYRTLERYMRENNMLKSDDAPDA